MQVQGGSPGRVMGRRPIKHLKGHYKKTRDFENYDEQSIKCRNRTRLELYSNRRSARL